MSITRSGTPLERVESLLEKAAELWIAENCDGPGLLEFEDSLPSSQNRFLPLAEHIFHEVLHSSVYVRPYWIPKPPDPRKPIEDICDSVPEDGRYILYYHMGLTDDNCEYLYIGKSIRCTKRQNEHKKSSKWWNEISYMEFDPFNDQASLDEAEVIAIKRFQPKYNVRHKNG